MTTLYDNTSGPHLHEERVEATCVIESALESSGADALAQRLIAGATALHDHGPLRIDTTATTRLQTTLVGSLPAMQVLDRVDADLAITAVVRFDAIQRPFADSLATHLLAAARQHPQEDRPLHVETAYHEPQHFEVRLAGSVAAVLHCCMLLHTRLTQRLVRKTSYV